MPSRHLIDPEIRPLVEMMPDFRPDQQPLDQMRAERAAMMSMRAGPPPEDVLVEERRIPGPDGAPEVRVLISSPKAGGSNRPGILHIHGGGYILGVAEMTLDSDAAYAQNLGAVCVSVDYRLAPDTPHPGPVEDCYAALKWMHANAASLGVDPARIAISGESAGGGLAAALGLLARDRGEIPVAFQHLIFPMLDDRTVVEADPSPMHGQFVWTRAANHFGWRSLLNAEPGSEGVSPYAAAARAESLEGLPPTFMICGALDLFLEENMEYARRLVRAGVPTEFHLYPGAPHAFMVVPTAHVTRAYARDSMTALSRGLGVG